MAVSEPLYGKNPAELAALCAETGLPRFAARQLARWLYVKHIEDPMLMTDIPAARRALLAERFRQVLTPPERVTESADGTKKYLFRTQQGAYIESAYIPDGDRATLCVSSQAGCRMGCKFCATGRQGLQHSLTAGVVPELRRLLDSTKVHLAVSLHNPFHEERAAIMPVERAWPVAEVAAILRRYDFTHQRRVSFEYIVMSGLNDSPRHIRELCRLLDGIKCRINLIRFHKIPGSPYFSPDDAAMVRLRDTLTAKGIQTTIRASRGEDIQAACGLLSTSALEGGQ